MPDACRTMTRSAAVNYLSQMAKLPAAASVQSQDFPLFFGLVNFIGLASKFRMLIA